MIALMPGMPGPFELIVIALIVLLLFGKRLPGLMRSLGQSVVEFKRGVNDPDQIESDSRDESTRESD
jgi:sec-independent protein translocase protein TatA